MSRVYSFVRSGNGHYTVYVVHKGEEKALPMTLGRDESTYFPLRDACVVMLADWLRNSDEADFQAACLARAMVTKLNQRRLWNNFSITEAEVGSLVAQILIDSYSAKVDAAFLATEYMGGERRDKLRQAIDSCVVPQKPC